MKLFCCLRLFISFTLELFFSFLQSLYTVLCQETAGFWAVSAQWKMLSLCLEQENILCCVTQAWQQVRNGEHKLEQ